MIFSDNYDNPKIREFKRMPIWFARARVHAISIAAIFTVVGVCVAFTVHVCHMCGLQTSAAYSWIKLRLCVCVGGCGSHTGALNRSKFTVHGSMK